MKRYDMIHDVRHPVLEEEQAWEAAVDRILGQPAELVSVSRYIGDCRVYRKNDQVAKIRSLRVALPQGVNRLSAEAETLKRLGRDAGYRQVEGWEALTLRHIDGIPLDRLLPSLSPVQRARLLIRLLPQLRSIHAAHVAHRDLRPDNVLVGPGGNNPCLVDFDRATIGEGWLVASSDWLGVAPWSISANPFWKLVLLTMAPRIGSVARRVRAHLRGRGNKLSRLPAQRDLGLLDRAWSLARQSPANAPGQQVAYYAFTYKARHFPGERPWHLRWEAIRRAVNFEGKRVLELGSNMGLLSSFAMIHGASKATGIDCDGTIIESARLVSEALNAGATFECVNLVKDPDWESRLAGADIVVAMSLLHWLPNKERLLKFLGAHREIIYEGHNPLDVEKARLGSVGFDDVSVIAQTERGRFILHAHRRPEIHESVTRIATAVAQAR
jgi:hypothetical protein